MERRGAAGHLERVDVRFDQERGLVEIGPGLEARHRDEPDIAILERAADALEAVDVRPLLRPALQDLRQLVVLVEAVEADLGHVCPYLESPVTSGPVSSGSKPIRAATSSLDGLVPS